MNEQNVKLEKVKKSCKTAKKITGALRVLLIAATVIAAAAGAGMLLFRDRFNQAVMDNMYQVKIDNEVAVGGLFRFSVNTANMIAEKQFAEAIAAYCISAAVICCVVAVIFGMIHSIFKKIEKSESPFDTAIIKMMKKIFITITVLTVLECGVGVGLILGLFLWCIYTIMDYGSTLQAEVDDTI